MYDYIRYVSFNSDMYGLCVWIFVFQFLFFGFSSFFSFRLLPLCFYPFIRFFCLLKFDSQERVKPNSVHDWFVMAE